MFKYYDQWWYIWLVGRIVCFYTFFQLKLHVLGDKNFMNSCFVCIKVCVPVAMLGCLRYLKQHVLLLNIFLKAKWSYFCSCVKLQSVGCPLIRLGDSMRGNFKPISEFISSILQWMSFKSLMRSFLTTAWCMKKNVKSFLLTWMIPVYDRCLLCRLRQVSLLITL